MMDKVGLAFQTRERVRERITSYETKKWWEGHRRGVIQ